MGYIGNQSSDALTSVDKQVITGNGGTTYTLSHPVANAQEIEVFVNNVRQEPGVAYTVSGTTLTMTGNVFVTDDFYIVFQGKAIQTIKVQAAGYYAGDNGNTGDLTNGLKDIFRLHEQSLDVATTIPAGTNAVAAGPLTFNATLTVNGTVTVV